MVVKKNEFALPIHLFFLGNKKNTRYWPLRHCIKRGDEALIYTLFQGPRFQFVCIMVVRYLYRIQIFKEFAIYNKTYKTNSLRNKLDLKGFTQKIPFYRCIFVYGLVVLVLRSLSSFISRCIFCNVNTYKVKQI